MTTYEVDLLLSMGQIDIETFDRESLKSREQFAREIHDKEVRLRMNTELHQLFRSANSVRYLVRSRDLYLLETSRGYRKDGKLVKTPRRLQPQTGTETRKPSELANDTGVRGVEEESGQRLPRGFQIHAVGNEVRDLHWSRVYYRVASAVNTVSVEIEIPDPSWWPEGKALTDTEGVESYPEWFDHWPFPLPFREWPAPNQHWPPEESYVSPIARVLPHRA